MNWLSTALLLTGTGLLSANIGWNGEGFLLMWLGSLGWLYCAIRMREAALATTNAAFLVINGIGIVRWLL